MQTDRRIWTKPAGQADVGGRGMEKEEVMLTTHLRIHGTTFHKGVGGKSKHGRTFHMVVGGKRM